MIYITKNYIIFYLIEGHRPHRINGPAKVVTRDGKYFKEEYLIQGFIISKEKFLDNPSFFINAKKEELILFQVNEMLEILNE